jgi:hypothetical protein
VHVPLSCKILLYKVVKKREWLESNPAVNQCRCGKIKVINEDDSHKYLVGVTGDCLLHHVDVVEHFAPNSFYF